MNSPSRIGNARGSVGITLALSVFSSLWAPSLSRAATYYVDANNPAAGDANPGTPALPFETISKATPLLRAADSLLIRAGTYRETVTLSRSGTAAAPITIQAYPGDEGKVIINAAEPVVRWRRCTGPQECAGNPFWEQLYVTDVAAFVQAHPEGDFAVRQVFQHGRLLNRSRYPNTGWSYPTAVTDPLRTFIDSALMKPEGYFVGSVCHIKTQVWQLDQIPITRFSRAAVTLESSPRFDIATRFGYYITSVVGEINEEGEWAYDARLKRLYLWPESGVPEGVEFTYRESCLCTTGDVSCNVVRGLTLRNAYRYGALIRWSHHITLEDNAIEYSFSRGIRVQAVGGSCDDNRILRNTIRHCCSSGINVDDTASRCTMEGNTIYAAGTEDFGGDLMNGVGYGIFTWGPFARVYNNRIDRTGSCGIYVASNPLGRDISFNYVTNTGLAISDNGSGLYTGSFYAGSEKDHIHHNIFVDALGCLTMDKNHDVGPPVTVERYAGESPGIYVDEEGNGRLIEHNTVINSRMAGIFFHWAPDNVVRQNTLYGNSIAQIFLSGKDAARTKLVGDAIHDNIMFATGAQQRTLYIGMNYNDVRFGESDRNYFYNPHTARHVYVSRYVAGAGGAIQVVRDDLTLDGWRAMSGYDSDSREFSYLDQLPQVTLRKPVQSRIVYNPSLDVVTLDPGPDLYCDVEGNGIRGKLTLQPFESKVLIAAAAAPVSYRATSPVPATGEQLGSAPILEWAAGPTAAHHDVYLGTDDAAVATAGTDSPLYRGRQAGTTFALQGLVEPGRRYFWRIDEVEADGRIIHPGLVWTFTVPGCLVIDDFEGYTDSVRGGIGRAWLDGSTNHTGAQVDREANPSAGWADDVHGRWSMALTYDNSRSPFVSEVEQRYTADRDWTAGAMDTVSLWFRGDVVSFEETTPGTIVLSAAGADIWGGRDEFRYAYKRLDGDGTIVARIEHVGDMDYWTKAGVMIRANLDPASAHAFMLQTPLGIRAFQNRPVSNSSSCFSAHHAAELRRQSWVKLERRGDRFTGYHSLDGINWTRQSETEYTGPDASPNPQTIRMPARVYVGLAFTSHAPGVAATATFSGVNLTGAVTGAWQVADIGVDHPGNGPDDLYVTVEDGRGKMATVVHPDPAAVNAMAWTEWRIPLSKLAGVDLGRVRKTAIGVGGRVPAVPPSTGRICIDDMRVVTSGPAY